MIIILVTWSLLAVTIFENYIIILTLAQFMQHLVNTIDMHKYRVGIF